MNNSKSNPYRYYLVAAFVFLLFLGATIWKLTSIKPIWIYIVSINIITFFFYGYDKRNAIKNKSRIPELVLHFLALAGGSIGGLAGQYVFHHKTKKLKFQVYFILIAILQICLIIWWAMKANN